MTTETSLTNQRVDTYLARLERALAGVSPPERSEIVREIRAHILDSVSGSTDPQGATDRVLRLLGAPEELANRYAAESLFTRARSSFSPLLLVHTSWRWAKLGMRGMAAFFLAIFGYTTALALTVSVFLKPFVPGVGLWLGREGLNVGVPTHPGQNHELLGQWFVPVIAVCAFAAAIGTTQALRWLIRRRASRPAYQAPK
jgi:uncharacterized membrane protein